MMFCVCVVLEESTDGLGTSVDSLVGAIDCGVATIVCLLSGMSPFELLSLDCPEEFALDEDTDSSSFCEFFSVW